MSNTSGTPFNDGPDPGDALAEFFSESDIERQTARPAGTSDELELFALEDVAARAVHAGRSRSFSWPLVTAAAVTAIVAVSLIGLRNWGRALPSGERLAQPAVSSAVSPLSSVPVVPYAAAAVTVIERVSLPTSSRVRGGKGRNTDDRAVALARATATAGATAISAHQPSSGNDVPVLPGVAPAGAWLLLAPVPASPTANPAVATSLASADLRVTATASDPDVTYLWSAPIGRFANAMERETVYTCPDTATTVALTVTVTDGHSGIASDTLTVHCVERR